MRADTVRLNEWRISTLYSPLEVNYGVQGRDGWQTEVKDGATTEGAAREVERSACRKQVGGMTR